ncbi:sorbosone dehydrogenase family protein [Terriglobus albidus]|uniref:Sorbosone dehydrogenase family protein n=1 Tax=Terriglobus albidus TaxID=1592106 RepID=A0A5B9EFW5_9BACT|nr:PQQ-dependent sugar dehydrogenase [Terriglobus albidus]QEE30015.1 sorbosone dehydrogenase family protein [Terriglobus albidus]
MKHRSLLALTSAMALVTSASVAQQIRTGQQAWAGYADEKPGQRWKITVADLPEPNEAEAVGNGPHLVDRPQNAWPQAPTGYKVEIYAQGFDIPRLMRTAPNGDVFLADSGAGTIKVLRGVGADGKAVTVETFASGLDRPFGIAFYPLGPNPQYVYVATTKSLYRYAYKNGDLKAADKSEQLIEKLYPMAPGSGHWTRDVVFSKDGKRMFISVGSGSNVDDMDTHPQEEHRADVLEFTPEGKFVKVYAAGIRNCVGEAVNPTTGELWCSTNERDNLGNNLVPDYITSVKEGGFYGWPWFYMGGHQDPRHEGKHPELKAKVITPDVLVQPHMASLQIMFYPGGQFQGVTGDIFAAEHGSWNRKIRAGYEVIRVPMKNGKPTTGEYEDFLTGFVTSEGQVWGRPVGVTTAKDGSLLVSDDGSRTIWRVSYTGKK